MNTEALVPNRLAVFSEIETREVSGWNDNCVIDERADPRLAVQAHIIQTVNLASTVEE